MSPSRFNRNYELTVQVSSGAAVVVEPPLRVSFSADKSAVGGLNKLTVSIYNLNSTHRLALAKDAEDPKRISVAFRVGYQDTMQLLFRGTIHRGTNTREGADFVTELECLDGGADFLSGFVSATVRGKGRAVDAVLSALPNTGKGKLTVLPDTTRPLVLVGPPARLLDSLVAGAESWYVDDEKLFILKGDEVVSNFIPVVSAATGLLNTPTREALRVTFDTLLNPTIRIGGLCNLVSASAPQMSGVYKIDSVRYTGDNYGANWMQRVTCLVAPNYEVI